MSSEHMMVAEVKKDAAVRQWKRETYDRKVDLPTPESPRSRIGTSGTSAIESAAIVDGGVLDHMDQSGWRGVAQHISVTLRME